MNKSKINQSILLLSFLPMLIHMTQHLRAKSYFPLFFLLVVVIVLSSLWFFKIVKGKKVVTIWCFFLVGYGLLRIALVGLIFLAESGVPSDIFYQIDNCYFVSTTLIISAGIWLLINKKGW